MSMRIRRSLAVVAWAPAVLIPLVFLLLFFAWPAATLIARGFTNEAGAWDLSAFSDIFSRSRTWKIIGYTLGMAVTATFFSVVLGIPGAHILYRCHFPGRSLLRAVVAIPFVLPTVVVGVAFRSLLAKGGWLDFLHLDGTAFAVLAAMVFFNYSLIVRGVGTVWSRLDPRMVEAARALGASPSRAFLTVTLPALAPAIISSASVVFLFCATAFGIVLILGGDSVATIESEIYTLTTKFLDLPAASVLSIVQLVVIAWALWMTGVARKRSERSLKLRADATSFPLSRADVPAGIITFATIGLVILLPLAALLWRSFHRKGEFTLANWTDLASPSASSAIRVSALEALWNSLTVAAIAAGISLSIGAMVAVVISRRPRSVVSQKALSVLDSVFMLPLGVSAVTVGFGFLITLNQPPVDLRSSPWLIPIAQAVVAIPLVVRMIAPVLRAIDPRQREAAAMLGASPLRVLLSIDGAHMVRAGAVAVGFAFATSLGEFGATSFLARPSDPTLPVVIFRLLSRPGAAEQGISVAASVLLALVAAVIMVIVERGRSSTAGDFA